MRGTSVLAVLSSAGLIISIAGQVAAVAFPNIVPVTLYKGLVGGALVTLVCARLVSQDVQTETGQPGRLLRAVYLLTGLDWIIWSLAYSVLVRPEAGAQTLGLQFAHPFAVWSVSEAAYRSLYLGWLAVQAAVIFCSIPYALHRASDHRQVDKAAWKWPHRMLRGRVLAALFSLPIALWFSGYSLLQTTFVDENTAQLLIIASMFWFLLTLLAVSVALIVSAIR